MVVRNSRNVLFYIKRKRMCIIYIDKKFNYELIKFLLRMLCLLYILFLVILKLFFEKKNFNKNFLKII